MSLQILTDGARFLTKGIWPRNARLRFISSDLLLTYFWHLTGIGVESTLQNGDLTFACVHRKCVFLWYGSVGCGCQQPRGCAKLKFWYKHVWLNYKAVSYSMRHLWRLHKVMWYTEYVSVTLIWTHISSDRFTLEQSFSTDVEPQADNWSVFMFSPLGATEQTFSSGFV